MQLSRVPFPSVCLFNCAGKIRSLAHTDRQLGANWYGWQRVGEHEYVKQIKFEIGATRFRFFSLSFSPKGQPDLQETQRAGQAFVGNIRQDQSHIIPPLHGPSPPFLPSVLPSLTCHNYRVNVRKDFTDFSPPPLFLTRLWRLDLARRKQLQLTQAAESVIIDVVVVRSLVIGATTVDGRMGALILPLTSRSPQESNFFTCLDVSNSVIPYHLTGYSSNLMVENIFVSDITSLAL